MIIEVMSREEVQKYSYSQHDEEVAIISISNYGEAFPNLFSNLNNGISAQCRVSFNDVEFGMINCITDDDADNIVSFANEIVVTKDKLIVHCEYGVSRSAGVAAAIMKFFTGNDSRIFNNPRYRPNITCYRKVMTAFHEVIDEHELSEKVAANRNLYEIGAGKLI